ncbi:MAG: alpha/beta fold hydrolase [Myxococcota bacterium]|nr:alpha/beta fold hydrolase [Myxococcota bacterium]
MAATPQRYRTLSVMSLMHTVHVPAGDGPYPTVVVLHGWGANAHDLLGLAPRLMRGNALVLSPQGEFAVEIAPGIGPLFDDFAEFGWFDLGGGREPDADEVREAGDSLRCFLDECIERYPVDPEQIALLGFSQGGVMAFELALREPERYAALIGLSTFLPDVVLASAVAGDALSGLPTLLMHGTEDAQVDIAAAHAARDDLSALGVTVEYREYAMGHEIRPEALDDLDEWLSTNVFR